MMEDTPSSSEKSQQRQREVENLLVSIQAPHWGAWGAAARRMGDLHAGVDALIEALRDPHESVRSAAAIALGRFSGDPRSDEIIEYLLGMIDDPHEKVCQSAIRSLGTLHAVNALPEIEVFLEDPNPYIVGAAVLALARLDAFDLGPRLAKFLEHESLYVRIQAVRAVGLLKYVQAGDKIVQMLEMTRQERLSEGLDLSARLEGREDNRYTLQSHLIRAAGSLQLKNAVPVLLEMAQKDIGLRGLAVEALISIGAEVAPELLAGLLSDPSSFLRRRLVMLVAQFNYSPALPMLRPLLREENATIRGAVLQAVTQMEDQDSISDIEWMCLHDSNPFIRVQAVESFCHLTGQDTHPLLLRLATDPNYQVRRTAVSHILNAAQVNSQAVHAVTRFATDFPEDPLSPAIAEWAKKCQENPEVMLANRQEDQPIVPPDLLQHSNLLSLLEQWQTYLSEMPAPGYLDSREQVKSAINLLIQVLKQQES